MDPVVIGRLRPQELPAFRAFCLKAWGKPHPLIHNEALFAYYYRDPDGSLRFAAARDRETGRFLSVCGWIAASAGDAPDVWISFLVSGKGAPAALSLRLFEFIREHTGCRTFACNNIRPKTRALYEFFGYTVAEMTQYYRINKFVDNYTICIIRRPDVLPVASSSLTAEPLLDADALARFPFEVYRENQPYKDRAYVQKRFFENQWFDYKVYALCAGGVPVALLVLRIIDSAGARVIRVVDFIGDRAQIPGCGEFLDRLMRESGAEFADWYAYGVGDGAMTQAGFLPRRADDPNILPNYLEPPLYENVDFTLFTSAPSGYLMFKADGDQDRANLG